MRGKHPDYEFIGDINQMYRLKIIFMCGLLETAGIDQSICLLLKKF